MSLCTARRCSNPTQTMLCADDLLALVGALRELAHGTVDRRDQCDRASDNAPRQGLLDDLEDTITRTDNVGPAGVKVRGADAVSIDFHPAASDLMAEARNTIGTWARDLHETNPHLHLPGTIVEACEWMAGLPGLLEMHPAAGEMCDGITALARTIRRMVDISADLTYLGICSARIGDTECEWDVFAEPDDTVVQCRKCGAAHEVSYRKGVMLKAMEDQLLNATDLRTALTRYMPQGVPAIGTLHRWASIGRLTKKPPLPGDSRPRYRIGDVLDLIAKQQQDGREEKGKAS